MLDGRMLLVGLSAALAFAALGGVYLGRRRRMQPAHPSQQHQLQPIQPAEPVQPLTSAVSSPVAPDRPQFDGEAAEPDWQPIPALRTAARQLAAALDAQASLFDNRAGDDVSTRCFDNFSAGYIGGFLDAALHQLDHGSTEAVGYATREAVALLTRHDATGATTQWLADDIDRLHAAGDSAFMAGVGAGANDASRWLNREIEAPAGWAHYVIDNAHALT